MYRVALRLTCDRARAEDLVQDTVVKALRFQERFLLGTNFKAWILTVETRLYIHEYRRQHRQREVAEQQDLTVETVSDMSQEQLSDPEGRLFRRLLPDEVVAALDALPEEFRDVVTLCDLEGLSYKELAEALEVPIGTVMSRLYRARRILETKLYALAVERGVVRTGADTAPSNVISYRRQGSKSSSKVQS